MGETDIGKAARSADDCRDGKERDRRTPRPVGASKARSVMECGCPLPLWGKCVRRHLKAWRRRRVYGTFDVSGPPRLNMGVETS